MTSETTNEVFRYIIVPPDMKMIIARVTSSADGDFITVTDMTTVEGCMGFATDGTPAAWETNGVDNVIKIRNGGVKNWSFLIWGY